MTQNYSEFLAQETEKHCQLPLMQFSGVKMMLPARLILMLLLFGFAISIFVKLNQNINKYGNPADQLLMVVFVLINGD